jgi:hypothetical protein
MLYEFDGSLTFCHFRLLADVNRAVPVAAACEAKADQPLAAIVEAGYSYF